MQTNERKRQTSNGAGNAGESAFTDTQRFTQKWLLWLLAIPVGFAWVGAFVQLVLRIPFGTRPAPDAVLLLIFLLFGLGLPFALRSTESRIRVDASGLQYQFFPFHLRRHLIRMDDVLSVASITYHPLLNFGGWGIRYGKMGKAYTVSGNRGVLVTLKQGRAILFGSQRADEFAEAFNKVKNEK